MHRGVYPPMQSPWGTARPLCQAPEAGSRASARAGAGIAVIEGGPLMKKRMMSLVTALALCLSMLPAAALAAGGDIDGHWAEETIAKWEEAGYISGYPDGTFRPDQPISRAEFVALTNRAFGFTSSAEISFQDVPPSYWGYEEIQKGVAAGYISGDDRDLFRPGDPVTRQEAAVMLAKINHLTIGSDTSALEGYTDSASIAGWAKPYVEAVTKAGVMSGSPDGSFGPRTALTRAEGVVALDRALSASENYVAGDFVLTEDTLKDLVVEGDLILSSSLGGKSVTLDNVTVKGTVKVQGGGTVAARSCELSAVELDQSGVVFSSDADTSVGRLEFLQRGTVKGQGYDSVVIAEDGVTEAVIDAAVGSVRLSTDAKVTLSKGAAVDTLDITEDAAGGTVDLSGGASVGDMNVRGTVRVTGQGGVSSMTVYVPGVTSSVVPDSLELKEDGETPSYTGGGTSGGTTVPGGYLPPVAQDPEVTAIALSPEKDSYALRDTVTATAALSASLGGKTVSWSADSDYVTVTPDPGDSAKAVIEIVNADREDKTVTISATVEGQEQAVEQQLVIQGFIPVTGISGVPVSEALNTPLTLTGTVEPADATHQAITWEIVSAGNTDTALQGGNTLSGATKAGTVKVRATIANGTLAGKYTEEFTIHLGPWVKELKVDKTAAVVGEEINVTAVVEHPADGYKIYWSATSSNITPTYPSIYETTTEYRATATAVFLEYYDPIFNIWANIVDGTDADIDPGSERIGVPIRGIPSVTNMLADGFIYKTTVEQGSKNTLTLNTDLDGGTFTWSIESPVEGVSLSNTEGESTTLIVGVDVPKDTQITVLVSVEGNPKSFPKTYTVVGNSSGTTTTEPDAP